MANDTRNIIHKMEVGVFINSPADYSHIRKLYVTVDYRPTICWNWLITIGPLDSLQTP